MAGSRCERTWPGGGKGAGGRTGRTGEGRYMGAGGRAAGGGRAIVAEAGCGADEVDIVGWALSSGGIGRAADMTIGKGTCGMEAAGGVLTGDISGAQGSDAGGD